MGIEDHVNDVNGSADRLGRFDSYRIIKPIGTGGYSKVYLVSKNGTRYAMKVPKSVDVSSGETIGPGTLDAESSARFMREARNWAKVSDNAPGAVIRLIDYNVKPFPWMVMELAECDFSAYMGSSQCGADDAVELLRKLDQIHDLDVIHRDIKPENILLVGGQWKFSDFGLSRIAGEMTDSTCEVKGTPMYMAPEQVSKKTYGTSDKRTDVWQMGILAYQMIARRKPYVSEDMSELLMEILGDGPDLSALPTRFRSVFSNVFSKEKDSRYSDAGEFADALEKASRKEWDCDSNNYTNDPPNSGGSYHYDAPPYGGGSHDGSSGGRKDDDLLGQLWNLGPFGHDGMSFRLRLMCWIFTVCYVIMYVTVAIVLIVETAVAPFFIMILSLLCLVIGIALAIDLTRKIYGRLDKKELTAMSTGLLFLTIIGSSMTLGLGTAILVSVVFYTIYVLMVRKAADLDAEAQ